MRDQYERGFFSPEDVERVRRTLSCDVERRAFLKRAGRWAGGFLLAAYLGSVASCGRKGATVPARRPPDTAPPAAPAAPGQADLAIASGENPGELARRAVDALGGMGRFVKRGDVVIVKPNASFMDGVEAATSTHPDVVGQVIAMCREAGAGRVIMLDHTLRGTPDACLSANGIGAAARSNGAEVMAYGAGDRGHGRQVEIPGALAMKNASVYPEVLVADVVITVPKAKHHGSAGLTLGMKNFIGVTTNMSDVHNFDLHQSIADLNTLVRPALSVIDASVILLDNGPGGPGPTRKAGQVIAGSDVVAADSYACTLFGMTAQDVPHIFYGNRAGLGEVDYNRLKVVEV